MTDDRRVDVRVVDAAATRALRVAVLRGGDPTYSAAPGDAPDALHLAAFDDDAVVGTGVLLPEPCPLWPDVPALRLRGMAVAPDDQGRGIGGAVLDAGLSLARDRGVDVVWCNARSSARVFYERHGFRVEGPEFVTADTGVPHFLMWWNRSGDPPRPLS